MKKIKHTIGTRLADLYFGRYNRPRELAQDAITITAIWFCCTLLFVFIMLYLGWL